jgi:hypothetical protein
MLISTEPRRILPSRITSSVHQNARIHQPQPPAVPGRKHLVGQIMMAIVLLAIVAIVWAAAR